MKDVKDMTFEEICYRIMRLADEVGEIATKARQNHLREMERLYKKAA